MNNDTTAYRRVLRLSSLLLSVAHLSLAQLPLQASSYITCGGNNAGFVLGSSVTVSVPEGAACNLESGYLKDAGATVSGTLNCSRVTYENNSGVLSSTLTGAVSGSGITLNNGDRLTLREGSTTTAITVAAGSLGSRKTATITGSGVFGNTLTVGNYATLNLAFEGVIARDITLSGAASVLSLTNDLRLAAGYQIASSANPTVTTNGYRLIFGGGSVLTLSHNLTFNSVGSEIVLNSPVEFNNATLTFAENGTIYGNGSIVDLGSGTGTFAVADGKVLTLTNMLLVGMRGDALALNTTGRVAFADVTLIDLSGKDTVTITGSRETDNQGAAEISGADGELFATESNVVVWENGALIDLHSSQALTGTWYFKDNATINGNGHILDLTGAGDSSSGTLRIASGKRLTLSNVILKGLADNLGDVAFDSATAEVALMGSTIVLAGDVTLTTGKVTALGDTTLVVGANKLYINDDALLTVNGVTLTYDTLTFSDESNIRLESNSTNLSLLNNGRIAYIQVADSEIIAPDTTYTDGSNILRSAEFLYHKISGVDDGHRLLFENADHNLGAFTFLGYGRGIYCGDAVAGVAGGDDWLLKFFNGATVTFEDTILDGLLSKHLLYDTGTNASSNKAIFGKNTQVRLNATDSLNKTYTFGSASGGTIVLDLQGHTIDLASANAAIETLNVTGNVLVIKNGMLKNLSTYEGAPKLRNLHSGGIIELENIDLHFSGDMAFTTGELRIGGNCRFLGTAARTFTFSSTGNLTIKTGATLQLSNEITYSHTGATGNFVFADSKARFDVRGATVSASGSGANLLLSGGTLEVDHISTFNGNFRLDTSLDVRLMPGASIMSTNGTITFVAI